MFLQSRYHDVSENMSFCAEDITNMGLPDEGERQLFFMYNFKEAAT